jgi:hypothetical protein
MEKTIVEQIGSRLVVELDPVTGNVQIVGEKTGVLLSAVEVYALTGFIAQHNLVIAQAALAVLDSQA